MLLRSGCFTATNGSGGWLGGLDSVDWCGKNCMGQSVLLADALYSIFVCGGGLFFLPASTTWQHKNNCHYYTSNGSCTQFWKKQQKQKSSLLIRLKPFEVTCFFVGADLLQKKTNTNYQ